jgi:hypothetical protein
MRARSFGEGFVDISMYVVLDRPSKNAACMLPDNLCRIFRELRLAVFERMCRLPIGLGSLRAHTSGWFPILRCRMSGIASGIVIVAAGAAQLSPRHSEPNFGPFWAAGPSYRNNSGRQPASLATHRAGRAYYIYVASRNAKWGFLAGKPKGSFGGPITFANGSVRPKQEQQQRSGGDRASQASGLKCPLGRALIAARQAR